MSTTCGVSKDIILSRSGLGLRVCKGTAYKQLRIWRPATYASKLAKIANQAGACNLLTMPTRNINLTDNQDQFVAQALTSGRYQNASEVVRDGLRMLERREAEDAAKLARLRSALVEAEGALASGDFEDVAVENLDGWLAGLSSEPR